MKELLNFVGICALVAILWGGISATVNPQQNKAMSGARAEGAVMLPLSNAAQH